MSIRLLGRIQTVYEILKRQLPVKIKIVKGAENSAKYQIGYCKVTIYIYIGIMSVSSFELEYKIMNLMNILSSIVLFMILYDV